MSEELINGLKDEIKRLNDANSKLSAEATRRKEAMRSLCKTLGVKDSNDLQTLVKEMAQHGTYRDILKDRDTLKSEIATPGELKKQLQAAQSEVRLLKHTREFEALRDDKDLGIRPEVKPERLMSLIGYQPESDDFDAKTVKAAILGLKETDPYLFGSASSEAKSPPTTPKWAARGASGQSEGSGEITSEQLRDPTFMLSQFGQAGTT